MCFSGTERLREIDKLNILLLTTSLSCWYTSLDTHACCHIAKGAVFLQVCSFCWVAQGKVLSRTGVSWLSRPSTQITDSAAKTSKARIGCCKIKKECIWFHLVINGGKIYFSKSRLIFLMYYKMELNPLASGSFWEWMGSIAITVVWPLVRFSVTSTNTLIAIISINTPTSYMCCVGLVQCMCSLVLAIIYGDESTGLSGDRSLSLSGSMIYKRFPHGSSNMVLKISPELW